MKTQYTCLWEYIKRIFVMCGMLLVVLFCAASSASAIELSLLSVYRDKTKSPEERIDILHSLLLDEISAPSKPPPMETGDIVYHDYVVAQIIKALYHVARELGDSRYLKQLANNENVSSAKEALQIAIGNCGDVSVENVLINVTQRKEQRFIRELAAEGLGECRSVLAIPDLIELLNDPVVGKRMDRDTGERKAYYPLRRPAFFALQKCGVTVKELPEHKYKVDKKTAVDKLEQSMNEASHEKKLKLLTAIGRVGGDSAKDALSKFIERNKVLADEREAKAKQVMSELK